MLEEGEKRIDKELDITVFLTKYRLMWAGFKNQFSRDQVRAFRQGKDLTIDSDQPSDESTTNTESDDAFDIPALKRPRGKSSSHLTAKFPLSNGHMSGNQV